jgi:type I site-specific restriction-modification system R (restriction) subunit
MVAYNEDAYELQCLDWLEGIGWNLAKGPEIAHDGMMPERSSHKDILLVGRVEDAISRINPGTPKEVIRKVRQMLESPGETGVLKANQQIHQWMTEGISVKVRDESILRILKTTIGWPLINIQSRWMQMLELADLTSFSSSMEFPLACWN